MISFRQKPLLLSGAVFVLVIVLVLDNIAFDYDYEHEHDRMNVRNYLGNDNLKAAPPLAERAAPLSIGSALVETVFSA